MLTKRLLLGALLLAASVIITGCATTDKSEDDYSRQYRNASQECISFGFRRNTYSYHRCIEKRLKSGKETPSPEQD